MDARGWRRLADPSRWPHERLFFEIYARALQGNPDAAPFLDAVIDAWIGPLTELYASRGVPPEHARAEARLGLAVSRGLLLDLLATEDREGVEAAAERYIAGFEGDS